MKKILLGLLMLVSVSVYAQSDRYMQAMKTTLALMDSAKTVADVQDVSAKFERIGDAEKTQWIPYYYAALCQINIGWMDKNSDKDQLAEKTKALISKGEIIEANSEFSVLRSVVATQQMLVNPASRYMTYAKDINGNIEKAIQQDPNNPRAYYMRGANVMGTPAAFGGGKDKAKPILQKSVDLFKSAKPASPFYPSWGLKQAEMSLAQCQ
ncbi:MAG: hypothetical protein JWN76_2277 [Chitinophagaceae bacterium]|nr:hypothetical protein [Chitinophagaceae bacterium]